MKQKITAAVLMIFLVIALCGCSFGTDTGGEGEGSDTGFVAAVAGNYDSADTAVLVRKNTGDKTLTFWNLTVGRSYTLSYDGATDFADKYGQAVSLGQISEGEVVDITFMKNRKRLNSMMLTPDVFRFEGQYDLTLSGSKLTIGKEEYTLDKNVAIVTGSGLGEWMDITSVDELTVIGVDHTVYSIVVQNGHGYLRLVNESYFVGGWIEVTQTQIYPIEEDMLLTVPVGTYDVTVSGSGCIGTETVTIAENEEYELDVSKWQGEEKIGTIVFTIYPDDTRIYLDGESIDATEPQELSYGIHQMIAIADGYETISKYIKVNSEYATLDVSLTSKNASEEDVSGNSISGNDVSGNEVSGNSVSDNSASGDQIGDGQTVSGNSAQQAGQTETAASTATPGSTSDTVSENGDGSQSDELTAPASNDVISSNGKYRVYIDGPEGVEVFVDGSYVGLAPVSFEKTIGSHDITLRKSGYQTRTYTISDDDSEKDVNYSFSDLLPIDE